MKRWTFPASAMASLLLLAACSKAPDDLREWTPADHDNTGTGAEGATAEQAAASRGQTTGTSPEGHGVPGLDDVTLVAWKRSCTSCHGSFGRGDGPQGGGGPGGMARARDLTSPEWQASVSDAQIAEVIRNGRGAMPAFNLPEATVQGLVRLIRLLNAARPGAPSGEASPEAQAPPADEPDGAAAPPADGAAAAPR